VAVVTLFSLATDDVSYARTRWTALLALLLAMPALILYVLNRDPPGRWWRAFWTVGWIAYLLHFWWAVFRAYNGDFGAVVARQGWVAYTNLAATVLWTLDVIAAWLLWRRRDAGSAVALRFLAWAGVSASFFTAAALFRTGTIAYIGYALAAALALALLARLLGLAPAADDRMP